MWLPLPALSEREALLAERGERESRRGYHLTANRSGGRRSAFVRYETVR